MGENERTFGEEYMHQRGDGFSVHDGFCSYHCIIPKRTKKKVIEATNKNLNDLCWTTMTHDDAICEILDEIESKIKNEKTREKLQNVAVEAINKYLFLTGRR